MNTFIDIADISGKHWCINTNQIILVSDEKGMTAFYINGKPEPITTYLKYDSILSLLQAH